MEPIVETSNGLLKGSIGEDLDGKPFYSFFTVPYGKSPTGLLRFKAPLPVESWDGIKDCTKNETSCYQRDIVTNEYGGSEDCLVSNIFTSSLSTKQQDLKPVMIFIHGGGFIGGSNELKSSGPEYLVTADIVLVTLNYRLGVLGFLSLEDPSLEVPGNAGLKDQLLALKWVQKNIRNFGGDPNNVTLFGESAGAASIHFHILSGQSEGLFHKAILQSGVVFNPWSWGTCGYKNLMEKLETNVRDEKEALNILTNLSVEKLYKLQELVYDDIIPSFRRPFGPVIEKPNPTAFLTEKPVDIIKSGKYTKVPTIIGFNSLEGMFVEGGHFYFPGMHKSYLEPKDCIPWNMGVAANTEQLDFIAQKLNKFYREGAKPEDKYNLEGDSLFIHGILTAVKYHLKTQETPIYLYEFVFEGDLNCLKCFLQQYSTQKLPGACHADELGYLFKMAHLPICKPESKEHITIKRIVNMWSNFAKYGNPTPNKELNVIWKPVEDEKLQHLHIGTELVMSEEPENDRMNFWKEIYNENGTTEEYLL